MSEHINPFYLHLLNEDYRKRNIRNNAYSIRAFAKQLEVNAGVLNQIMNGKRGLPYQVAEKIIGKLDLTEKEQDLFMRSAFYSKQELDILQKERSYKNVFLMTDQEKFCKVMSEWEYFAFIALMDVFNFSDNIEWAAKKLNISLGRMEEVISVLLKLDIIKKGHKTYTGDFDKITSQIERDSHMFKVVQKNNLNMAIEKIDKYTSEECHFSSITLAIQPRNIQRAKLLTEEFILRLTSLLEDGNQEDVYKCCVQLFPISLTENETNKTI